MFVSDSLRIGQYAPYGVMAPHSHDCDSLGVILDGDFVEHIGGSERRYKKGCVTFGPAGITHAQRFGADGARQIIVTPESDWLSYLASKGVRLADAPFVEGPLFLQLGTKLLNEIQRDDDFTQLARESILLEIIAAFGRADIAQLPARPPVWLLTARDYLHEHVTSPISMKQVARVVGRHEIHLAREFKRYFGLSVGSYLRQTRTERAADLLRTTRANITEIALRCGFANHAHLCRAFRAHFGMSPSQYRAQ